jgi:SecD/SecF fusion protein
VLPIGWVVEFALQPDAAASFDVWTGQHVGDFFAVVLDGTVVEAPYIQAASTGGKGRLGLGIGGGLGEVPAHDLATILRSGPLPVSLQVVSYSVSPTPSEG